MPTITKAEEHHKNTMTQQKETCKKTIGLKSSDNHKKTTTKLYEHSEKTKTTPKENHKNTNSKI